MTEIREEAVNVSKLRWNLSEITIKTFILPAKRDFGSLICLFLPQKLQAKAFSYFDDQS